MRIVAGKYKGRRLLAPLGQSTRPTVSRAREAIFSTLGGRPPGLAGCRFLDLYAGSGAIGFEAVSRGAARVLLVDRAATALGVARRNIEILKVQDTVSVMCADASKLGIARQTFDLVFMDPPYRSGLVARTLEHLGKGGWLESSTLLLAEIAAQETVPAHPSFNIIEERKYGAAKILFIKQNR